MESVNLGLSQIKYGYFHYLSLNKEFSVVDLNLVYFDFEKLIEL